MSVCVRCLFPGLELIFVTWRQSILTLINQSHQFKTTLPSPSVIWDRNDQESLIIGNYQGNKSIGQLSITVVYRQRLPNHHVFRTHNLSIYILYYISCICSTCAFCKQQNSNKLQILLMFIDGVTLHLQLHDTVSLSCRDI